MVSEAEVPLKDSLFVGALIPVYIPSDVMARIGAI